MYIIHYTLVLFSNLICQKLLINPIAALLAVIQITILDSFSVQFTGVSLAPHNPRLVINRLKLCYAEKHKR